MFRIFCFVLALLVTTPVWAEAGIRTIEDHPYGPHARQVMDIYFTEPAPGAKRPVIMMVHGGGWIRGDKAMDRTYRNKVAHWVPAGYVFIAINYRLVPDIDPLEQARDVARAVRQAQAESYKWGADPDRFILMGHSAGAHLVALLNADPAIGYALGAWPWLGAVALDSATLDVVAAMRGRGPLQGVYKRAFPDDPDFQQSASPYHRLSPGTKPLMIVCSTRRRDPCDQAKTYAVRARTLEARIDIVEEDLSHGDINEIPGQPHRLTGEIDRFMHGLISGVQ